MYKIFFDSRIFVISDDFNQCFTQSNGAATKANTELEMKELVKYFEAAYQTHALWVYVPNVVEAFGWFCKCFTVVEAAGGLVQNKVGDYLLIFRFGHWDLPKGKREKNESVEETALREVEEECSLSNLNLYSHIIDTCHVYKQKGEWYLKKTSWYKMKYRGNTQPKPQVEEAIERALWVRESDLGSYRQHMYCSVVDVFNKILIVN